MPRARCLGVAALLAIPFVPAAGRASPPSLIVFSADRSPLLSGEIYRLDPNGHRVDLSRSPHADTQPLVSPDGRRVAFFSDRGGAIGVFEVRIDGTQLRNIGPSLSTGAEAISLAWQPHGGGLAALTGNGRVQTLWILRRGHRPQRALSSNGVLEPSWSPDGRVLLAWSRGAWLGLNPAGRHLWRHESALACCGTSWSSRGLLAIASQRRLAVYGENGRRRFEARLPHAAVGLPSWSPDDGRVGLAVGRVVEVWTASGRLELRERVPRLDPTNPSSTVWADKNRLVAGQPYGEPGAAIDVRTGKVSVVSSRWFAPRSTDGKLAIVTRASGTGFAIGTARVRGGAPRTYAPVPGCWEDGGFGPAADSLQFAGQSRSVVYASACYEPFSNLYSIAPDGTALRELSAAQPYIEQPAVSPDGSTIAYSWSQFTGLSCKGCASEIRVVGADGSGQRVLTAPDDCTFDVSPTWSPDGSTILFSESGCDSADELYTVPAGGGAVHDLGIGGRNPAWGPSKIAYESADGIRTANPDGTDPVEVGPGALPAWSRDGRLAYLTGRLDTSLVIGSAHAQLPFAQVVSLAWSADGTRLVVTARKTTTAPFDVYTVKTDGTDPIRLTKDYDASGASWR